MGEVYILIGITVLLVGIFKGPITLDILGAIFLVCGSIIRRMK